MMRITDNIMAKGFLNTLNSNLKRISDENQRLSSGRNINSPSDDPVGTSQSMLINSTLQNNGQYRENIEYAQSWNAAFDDSLSQAVNIIHRARELAIYAGSEALSSEDKNAIGEELKELNESLFELTGTNHAGRYLFSGHKTDHQSYMKVDEEDRVLSDTVQAVDNFTEDISDSYKIGSGMRYQGEEYTFALYDQSENAVAVSMEGEKFTFITEDDSGKELELPFPARSGELIISEVNNNTYEIELTRDKYEYQGNAGYLNLEIGRGIMINLNSPGNKVFEKSFKTVGDLLGKIEDGSVGEIELDSFDSALDNILSLRSEVGARVNRLQLSEERFQDMEINLRGFLSEIEEVDLAETIMELKMAESVYRASLSSGARIIQPSLVDFLR